MIFIDFGSWFWKRKSSNFHNKFIDFVSRSIGFERKPMDFQRKPKPNEFYWISKEFLAKVKGFPFKINVSPCQDKLIFSSKLNGFHSKSMGFLSKSINVFPVFAIDQLRNSMNISIHTLFQHQWVSFSKINGFNEFPYQSQWVFFQNRWVSTIIQKICIQNPRISFSNSIGSLAKFNWFPFKLN